MEKFICKFCNKELGNKSSLNKHIQTAKKCIQNREEQKNTISFKCDKCEKTFTSKLRLQTHTDKCVNRIIIDYKEKIDKLNEDHTLKIEDLKNNYQIKENDFREKIKELQNTLEKQQYKYEEQIKELQNKLENIAIKAVSKSTTTNNTSNNISNYSNNTTFMNLAPLDMDKFKERVEHEIMTKMNDNHLLRGQEGIADLVAKCLIDESGKKMIMCSDVSRGIWKSKDIKGNIIKDYKAKKIADVAKPVAIVKADELLQHNNILYDKAKLLKNIIIRRKEKENQDEHDKKELLWAKGLEADRIKERMTNRNEKETEDNKLEYELINIDNISSGDLGKIAEHIIELRLGKDQIHTMAVDTAKFSNRIMDRIM